MQHTTELQATGGGEEGSQICYQDDVDV